MNNPKTNVMPAWYELATKGAKTLLIRIHRVAMRALESMREDSPIIRSYTNIFLKSPHPFGKFVLPREDKSWGFGEVLIPQESKDNDWLTYACRLPILAEKGQFDETKTDVMALRSTLSVIFNSLFIFDGETGCKKPQLMVVEAFSVHMEIYGGAMGVTLTPAVSHWLSQQPDNSCLIKVEDAMRKAGEHMWNDSRTKKLFHQNYHAWCRQPKWINLSVPGNACGLDPSDYYDTSLDRGYTLSPHNTDSSWQQLTLLVGLAKLHELIRGEDRIAD